MRDNEIRYKQTGWENKKSTEVNGAPIRKYERDVARIVTDPIIRQINDYVSQWSCGRYFFYWQGDEILLEASNDKEAIAAGDKLLLELSNEYERN